MRRFNRRRTFTLCHPFGNRQTTGFSLDAENYGRALEDSETANAIMVEALLFYAEKTNYGLLGGTRMRTDKGAKARFALNPGKYYLGSVRTVLSEPTKVRSAMEEIQEISERYANSETGWSNGDMSEIWQIVETLFYSKAGEC